VICKHLLARPGAAQCPSCGKALAPEPPIAAAWEKPPDEDPDAWRRDQAGWTNDEYLAAAKAKRARSSLAWFVREAWHVLEPGTVLEWGPHLQALCDHVQWLLEDWMRAKRSIWRGNVRHKQLAKNALFWVAPRSLKTRIILECAPAWMWLHFPSWSVRCVSINPSRALESARSMRIIVESEWYRNWFCPTWRMRDDRDAVGDFGNTAGGYRKSTGMGAQIIGAGSDAIFCDDPNDPTDDDNTLENVYETWIKKISGRLNDRRIDVRIIVQQRTDIKDLSGRLMESDDVFHWMVLSLPLFFVSEHACETVYGWRDWRTQEEQILHERFTSAVVAELRKEFGDQFEAVAQQNPQKRDGEQFKMSWWRFWRLADDKVIEPEKRPAGCSRDGAIVLTRDRHDGRWDVDKVVVTVDPTGASEDAGASHVGLIGCVNAGSRRLVVQDFGRGPRNYPDMLSDIENAIRRMADMTKHNHIHLLMEKTVLGPALCAEVTKRVTEAQLLDSKGQRIHVTIEDYTVGGTRSKQSRFRALEVPISVGEVFLREDAEWLPKFFDEFKRQDGRAEPRKPNDRIDALAQYVDHYRSKKTWRDAMQNIRNA
jgi:hypothetical protein